MLSTDKVGYDAVKTRRKPKQMTEHDKRALIKKQKETFQSIKQMRTLWGIEKKQYKTS